ncbi:helix-turn-helix domain-containing protein [Streptomyces sp. NPDC002640]
MTPPRPHTAAVTGASPEGPFSDRLDLPFIKKGRKLTGAARQKFAAQVVAAYRTPGRRVTIAEICAATNRSYGAIHSLLSQAGATKRAQRTADTDSAAEQVNP